jgi:hypothetical protein
MASNRSIPRRTAAELVARMPSAAIVDMMEWGPGKDPEGQFNLMLAREININRLIAPSPASPALSDDRPMNEYYLVRSSPYY